MISAVESKSPTRRESFEKFHKEHSERNKRARLDSDISMASSISEHGETKPDVAEPSSFTEKSESEAAATTKPKPKHEKFVDADEKAALEAAKAMSADLVDVSDERPSGGLPVPAGKDVIG